MSNQHLTMKLHEYQQLKRLKEETEAAMKALQAEITDHMTAESVTELVVDAYKVSYKAVTSTRLDSKAFKAAQPALYAQFSVTTTSRRFLVL